MNCRHCNTKLLHTFLDLGFAPPSNAYLTIEDLPKTEKSYPLKIMVCDKCWLVQTLDFLDADQLFTSEYSYFSSTSSSWLDHSKSYVDKVCSMLALDEQSQVLEVASNDGYLLKNFVERNIPCLGIEPTDSTANAAEELGIPVVRKFFDEEFAKYLASKDLIADLIVGNNVYAHVPDINDFTRGLKIALKPSGTITLEFPHLMRLIEHGQFDTIYHEHYSYLSLYTSSRVLANNGLRVYNVEELTTHGGSLRIYACHQDDERQTHESVEQLLIREEEFGLKDLAVFKNFKSKVEKIKSDLLSFLIEQRKSGKSVVGYGAAAKGNTLLNYAGVKTDLLKYVVDASASKWNKYLPGSQIPIYDIEILRREEIDYLLILPWNIKEEVILQNSFLLDSETKFCVAIPHFHFCKTEQ
ncbi:MAG: methyltransferase domain-containing protein [Opitutae bacterium]|jgi:hypothetical protein|nr:methyltransferase domain-containing protein [Opitutae bacterium]